MTAREFAITLKRYASQADLARNGKIRVAQKAPPQT